MLVGILTVLSLAAALGLCFGTGAFENFYWLWMLPVSGVVAFLLLAALAFGFLLLACHFVDPYKDRETDSKFFRTMANWYVEAALFLLPVEVKTRGLEQIPQSGRFLLVCNHLHDIDPAFLLRYFKKSQLAFIAKREVREMFLVGKILPMLLCSFINRENDKEALKTIIRCIKLLKEDKVSVAVFPEGYIHQDRKLYPFRPGVFKIAQKANVPVVVCTLRDTQHVLKKVLSGKKAVVELHLLTVVPAETVNSMTTVALARQIHDMMAEDLGPEYLPQSEDNT